MKWEIVKWANGQWMQGVLSSYFFSLLIAEWQNHDKVYTEIVKSIRSFVHNQQVPLTISYTQNERLYLKSAKIYGMLQGKNRFTQ
jgi:hypothetical protein